LHLLVHPFVDTVSLSSHYSTPTIRPSPHFSVQTEGKDEH